MSQAQQQADELMEAYRRRRQEAADLQRRLAELTATAADPRQVVVATVGAQGELTALEFPTGAHKRLPPKELAELIVTTTARARAEVRGRAADLLAPSMPPGLDVRGLMDGTVSASAALPEEPVPSDEVREYLAHGPPSRTS